MILTEDKREQTASIQQYRVDIAITPDSSKISLSKPCWECMDGRHSHGDRREHCEVVTDDGCA